MKNLFKYLLFLIPFLVAGCSKDDEKTAGDGGENSGKPVFLTGSVVIDGEPVNAAAVLLTPGGGCAITGSDGIFYFESVEPGQYELRVYKEGCHPFNKSLTVKSGKDENIILTLSKNDGDLRLNKAFIDMGANESNNVAAFTIINDGKQDLHWNISNAAKWISHIEPMTGKIPVGGSATVTIKINRSKLSTTTFDNYASLVVKSTNEGNGAMAELLLTVYGNGDGTNTENDNTELDYVMVGDLYVQTNDISEYTLTWNSADLLCKNSFVGGFRDWRLPTLDELAMIFQHQKSIGGFAALDYWASDIEESTGLHALMDFKTGELGFLYSSSKCRARAVRTNPVDHLPKIETLEADEITESSVKLSAKIKDFGLPTVTEFGFVYSDSDTLPTIGNSIKNTVTETENGSYSLKILGLTRETTYYARAYATNALGTSYGQPISFLCLSPDVYLIFNNLIVQKKELSWWSNWEEADRLCRNSTEAGYNDWRLPTIEELQMMYQLRKLLEISDSSVSVFWSSEEAPYEENEYKAYSFYTREVIYESKYNRHYVRAVRTLGK